MVVGKLPRAPTENSARTRERKRKKKQETETENRNRNRKQKQEQETRNETPEGNSSPPAPDYFGTQHPARTGEMVMQNHIGA